METLRQPDRTSAIVTAAAAAAASVAFAQSRFWFNPMISPGAHSYSAELGGAEPHTETRIHTARLWTRQAVDPPGCGTISCGPAKLWTQAVNPGCGPRVDPSCGPTYADPKLWSQAVDPHTGHKLVNPVR